MNDQIQTETADTSAPKLEVANFLDKEPPEVTEAKQLAVTLRVQLHHGLNGYF